METLIFKSDSLQGRFIKFLTENGCIDQFKGNIIKEYIMKRMNRKKILEVLETARQGYSSLVFKAREIDDKIMEISCQAHHGMLNGQIVELGGESVDAPLLFKNK